MAKSFEDLRRKMSQPRQARARKRTHSMLAAIALGELRRGRGITQDQVANVLNVRQAAVSKLEGRDDLLLSTLAAYVRALGGALEIAARFGKHTIPLDSRGATAKVRRDSSRAGLNHGRKPPKAKRRS